MDAKKLMSLGGQILLVTAGVVLAQKVVLPMIDRPTTPKS